MCTSYLVWGDGPFVGDHLSISALASCWPSPGTSCSMGRMRRGQRCVNQRLRLVTWVRCITYPLSSSLYVLEYLLCTCRRATGMSPPLHTYMGRVEHGVLCKYASPLWPFVHDSPLLRRHAGGGQRALSESCAGAVINECTHARTHYRTNITKYSAQVLELPVRSGGIYVHTLPTLPPTLHRQSDCPGK